MDIAKELENNYANIEGMARAWGICNVDAIRDIQQDYAVGFCNAAAEGESNPHRAGVRYADKMCRRNTRHNQRAQSIDYADAITGVSVAANLADTAADTDDTNPAADAIWSKIDILSGIEKTIILAMYKDGKSNKQIAAEHGFTKAYISRKHHEALAVLRAAA